MQTCGAMLSITRTLASWSCDLLLFVGLSLGEQAHWLSRILPHPPPVSWEPLSLYSLSLKALSATWPRREPFGSFWRSAVQLGEVLLGPVVLHHKFETGEGGGMVVCRDDG